MDYAVADLGFATGGGTNLYEGMSMFNTVSLQKKIYVKITEIRAVGRGMCWQHLCLNPPIEFFLI